MGEQEDGWALCHEDEDWKNLECLMAMHNNYLKDHPEAANSMEVPFVKPPVSGALTKLLWVDQEPVGFYILRLKGAQEESQVPFEMNILDGVYVSQSHRRKGWATSMLHDLTTAFPNQDLGFSQPISHSLHSVLIKFLTQHPEQRNRFWSVSNCGEEGDRLNLWFSRHNKNLFNFGN